MLKYLFPLVLILASCGGTSKTTEKAEEKNNEEVVAHFANENEMDKRKVEIDTIAARSGLIASSLYFSKNATGESIQVDGHMNDNNVILKMEEFFSEGTDKNTGRRIYYLNNGKPFLIHEEYSDYTGVKPQFVDRITYYGEDGKALKTKERKADYQEISETLPYQPVGLVSLSIDRVMRAMNQEKEFSTTFQGFIHSDIFSYISVGENRPDGFRSALRLDFKDPLIMSLSANESGYLGELLRVNYEKHTDEHGMEFQIYAGGKFVD